MNIPAASIDIKPDFAAVLKDDDLLKQLAEQTETKPEPEPPAPEPEPEPIKPEPAAAEIKAADAEAERRRKIYGYEEEAEIYIDLFDAAQELGFTFAYKKFLLSAEDKEVLKLIKEKTKALKGADIENITFTKHELKVLDKAAEIDEDIEALPLTDKEINRLKKPLTACLEIWGRSTNPSTALSLAALSITVPRLLPFMRKK